MSPHKRLLILVFIVLAAMPSQALPSHARTPQQQRRANARLIALWTDTKTLMTRHAVENALNQGADIDSKDKRGNTSLIEAAGDGDAGLVSFLLSRGANVNAANNIGNTALMEAQPVHVTPVPEQGNNQSQFIIEISDSPIDPAVAKLLLAHGAAVNAKNHAGETALMKTAFSDAVQIAKILLSNGALVNAQDNDGNTALIIAAIGGKVDMVNLLLGAGADMNIKDQWGDTALMTAASMHHPNVVKFLTAAGAK